MGLFGSNKPEEERQLERVAKCLESLNLQVKDGLVHAGWFEVDVGLSGFTAKTSQVLDGVFEYVQKRGYEIVNVQMSMREATLNPTVLMLYK